MQAIFNYMGFNHSGTIQYGRTTVYIKNERPTIKEIIEAEDSVKRMYNYEDALITGVIPLAYEED